MYKGRIRSGVDRDQVVIPEAYIIDELTNNHTEISPELNYQMPHIYELDEREQAPIEEEEPRVIIIEL